MTPRECLLGHKPGGGTGGNPFRAPGDGGTFFGECYYNNPGSGGGDSW